MKNKILFILVLLTFIFSIAAYSAEKKKMRITAINSMERIRQSEKSFGTRRIEIKAAKNEVESFQVVVAAFDEDINVTNAEISDLIGDNGSRISKDNIKLYREEYVRVRRSTPRSNSKLIDDLSSSLVESIVTRPGVPPTLSSIF